MGIALSLPSTIFVFGALSMKLVEWGYLSKFWAVLIFLLIIINSFILLVWHASRKKN